MRKMLGYILAIHSEGVKTKKINEKEAFVWEQMIELKVTEDYDFIIYR